MSFSVLVGDPSANRIVAIRIGLIAIPDLLGDDFIPDMFGIQFQHIWHEPELDKDQFLAFGFELGNHFDQGFVHHDMFPPVETSACNMQDSKSRLSI